MKLAPDPRALAAVRAVEDRVAAERDLARVRLQRLKLQASVSAVSPLTRDLIERHGSTLRAIAHAFIDETQRYRGGRERHLIEHRRKGFQGRAVPAGVTDVALRQDDVRMSRRIARWGVLLREPEGSSERVGVVPDAGVIESAGWLGSCWFRTEGRIAHLHVDLPETVLAAVPGRAVREVVDHPALSDPTYRVGRVTSSAATGRSILTFRTGLLEHRMPWADQLALEMERVS
jgi:hypothetical protein